MTTRQYMRNLLQGVVMATVLAVPLSGCLSLDEWNDSSSPVTSGVTDVVISGSVGDGPVTGATITVYSADGDVLGSMVSDSTASFKSTLKLKGNQYPLRLVVSDGIDLVTGMAPDFEMVSTMLHPSDKQVNINPFTTLIVMLAEKMPGGLNSSNIDAARPVVLDQLGFGLDPGVFSNPITATVNFDNVANLVKASEALGEMVRRTRDQIAATGKSASGDSVLAALSGDLTDGVIDGLGGVGANPTVASVANVVSGQVLVEAMSNNLRVSGVIATSIIDQAIATTRSGISSTQLTGSVAIDAAMIDQARIAVASAQVLDSGSAVTDIAADIASLSPDSMPAEIEPVLPADSSLALDTAVQLVATASSTEVAAINEVVASGGTIAPAPAPAPGNTVPVISGTPAVAVTANSAYVFQPSAADSDGDSLMFMISNRPSWASFSESTGRLSGTPADADAGSYGGIVISVTDGTDTASLAAFSIQVNPEPVVNTAPVIGGSPAASVTAGSSYAFQPTASDADGDTLGFSISNKPSWASFNAGTGRLSGTPADTDAGSYGGIVISVTDGTDTASLAAFSVQVDPAPVNNTAPVIGGTPAASVNANSSYLFQPLASDADGDSLTFSISNKPSWASFNTGTGQLGGTPANTDAGSYGGIVISVSDGTATTSLPTFSITVNAQTGSMTVSWVAPVARADGSSLSLSDIAGYRLYYGTTAGSYPNSVDITDGAATSATIDNLPVGPYYIVMSTYDTNGLEGGTSAAVAKAAQ